MQIALDLALFLLGLGFTEVIVKPLAMNLFRRVFSLLPKLFDRLDPMMPDFISHLTSDEIERQIYLAINGVSESEGVFLTEEEKKKLFDEFITRYDPVIAAAKIGRTQ